MAKDLPVCTCIYVWLSLCLWVHMWLMAMVPTGAMAAS